MQDFTITTKEVLKKLPKVVEKGRLKLEDMVMIVDYDTKTDLNQEAVDDLLTAKLIKEPKNHQCFFFKGNWAYLRQDEETGVWAYFSVNYEKGERFCLMLHNFFTIFAGGNYGLGVSNMLKAYKISTKEEEGIADHRNKYERNLEKTRDAKTWKDFPFLYENIKTALPTLQALNSVGGLSVMRGRHNINGEHVFFASTRFVAGIIGKSVATSSNCINFLCLLGFIQKAKTEELPEDFTKGNAHFKEHQMKPSFYTVKEIDAELLKAAQAKLEKIEDLYRKGGSIKKRLTATSLTRKTVEQFFGKEEALRVFPNNQEEMDRVTFGKNVSRAEKRNRQERFNNQPDLPF